MTETKTETKTTTTRKCPECGEEMDPRYFKDGLCELCYENAHEYDDESW